MIYFRDGTLLGFEYGWGIEGEDEYVAANQEVAPHMAFLISVFNETRLYGQRVDGEEMRIHDVHVTALDEPAQDAWEADLRRWLSAVREPVYEDCQCEDGSGATVHTFGEPLEKFIESVPNNDAGDAWRSIMRQMYLFHEQISDEARW